MHETWYGVSKWKDSPFVLLPYRFEHAYRLVGRSIGWSVYPPAHNLTSLVSGLVFSLTRVTITLSLSGIIIEFCRIFEGPCLLFHRRETCNANIQICHLKYKNNSFSCQIETFSSFSCIFHLFINFFSESWSKRGAAQN